MLPIPGEFLSSNLPKPRGSFRNKPSFAFGSIFSHHGCHSHDSTERMVSSVCRRRLDPQGEMHSMSVVRLHCVCKMSLCLSSVGDGVVQATTRQHTRTARFSVRVRMNQTRSRSVQSKL